MDGPEISPKTEVKEVPPIPIKTYKWEEVRRARIKGGYPWTYLDKEPFYDDIEDGFRMEEIRKTRSSNDVEQKSEVEITEVTNGDSITTQDQEQHVEEPMDISDEKAESPEGSADISISQYLDKDEKEDVKESVETPSTSQVKTEDVKLGADLSKRAKSEEPGRKRKHSIESSHSRVSKYSLSKIGIMKRLKNAKEKIKLPKFSFSKSDTKLCEKAKNVEEAPSKPKPETKKEEIKTKSTETKKIEEPLYIHIPLKPPPGETDEFSYLEFEEPKESGKRPSPIKEETKEQHEEPESPVESKAGVQFIIVTAPSDDEFLATPIPETPSESNDKFFDNNKMDELKTMARDVVDKYSPETRRKMTNKEGVIVEEVEDEAEKFVEETDEGKKSLAPKNKTKKKKIGDKESETEETITVKDEKIDTIIGDEKIDDEKVKRENEVSAEGKKDAEAIVKSEDKMVADKDKVDDENKEEIKVQEVKKVKVKKVKKIKKKASEDKVDDEKKVNEPDVPKPEEQQEKTKEEKIIETQKTDDDKLEEQKTRPREVKIETKEEIKMSVDEEDGLKTETVIAQIIAEEVKDSDKKDDEKEKHELLLKKKVSFKRRSKDDGDGVYEEVQVTTEVDTKPATDLAQSMSVDEEKSYLDEKLVKETSLEEDYKWSKISDHEYEPVNPPPETSTQEPAVQNSVTEPKKPSTPVTDSDIEFLAAKAADFELRTTGIMTVQDQPSKGGDAIFVPLGSALKAAEEQAAADKEPAESHGKKIGDAIKNQASKLQRQASILGGKASKEAGKIHTRVKSIKRPKLHMPEKPTFKKPTMPKMHKPKMPKMPSMPKMPDRMKNLSMPTFTLPKGKGSSMKRSTQGRQFSTESNVGDSKKKIFDFSTYPRIFSRKKKEEEGSDEAHTPRTGTDITPTSERSTLPLPTFNILRWRKGKFTETATAPSATVDSQISTKDSERSDTRDSVRIPLHSEDSMDKESLDLRTKEMQEMDMASADRYDDDIDMDDAYMKENQEIHRASSLNAKLDRWTHGTFHDNLAAGYDKENEKPMTTDLDGEVPEHSSSLRKKIENIHSGSSDDIHRRGVMEEISNDEFILRQKGISQDNIEVRALLSSEIREAFGTPNNALSQMESDGYYHQQSANSDPSLPEAPKRRPLKKPKRKKTPHVSQEALAHDRDSVHTEPEESFKYYEEEFDKPERPKRKPRKERSLDTDDYGSGAVTPGDDSAFDSREIFAENILSGGDYEEYRMMYENERMQGKEQPGIVVSDPYQEAFRRFNFDDVPSAPPRRHRSLKSLTVSEHDSITAELNGYKDISDQHLDSYRYEQHEYQIPTPEEPPKRPARTRSRTRSHSRTNTQLDDDVISESVPSIDLDHSYDVNLDYIGYSVIDKNKRSEQPSAPRRRRSLKSNRSEEKFFTVPRRLNDEDQPVRPLRNYSTLGPSRPPRKRSVPNLTDEEKEIVNVSPYIEIEDDEHKNLQSGEVMQKMKDRPLPAPPRPPRRGRDSSRGSSRALTDIISDSQDLEQKHFDETEVSVQTEPLPEGFECEELVQETDDVVITPSVDKKERRPVTEFEHQETITHGALVVQTYAHNEPIEETPVQMFSRDTERIITVKREVEPSKTAADEEETSEIPEDFKKLKDPQPQIIERIIERQVPMRLDSSTEVEVLKAHKLQVTDLDVDRLSVNELHASKIKVAEIDSSSINVTEINSSSGNLIVSGIELPASFFQQLMEKLQEQSEHVLSTHSQHEEPQRERVEMSKVVSEEKVTSTVEHKEEDVTPRKEQTAYLDITPQEDVAFASGQVSRDTMSPDSNLLGPPKEVDERPPTPLDEEMSHEQQKEEIAQLAQEIERLLSQQRSEESEPVQQSLTESEEMLLERLRGEIGEDLQGPVVAEEEVSEEQQPTVVEESGQARLEETSSQPQDEDFGKKKTPIEERLEYIEYVETEIELVVDPPQRPPRLKTTTQTHEVEPQEAPQTEPAHRFTTTPITEEQIEQETQPQAKAVPIPELAESPDDKQETDPIPTLIRGDSEETPPPRPPHPDLAHLPSQPPQSFYALRSPPTFRDFDIDDDIPMAPRRRRHHKAHLQEATSSDEVHPATRRRHRTPEPSIPQLTGQLTRACVTAADRSLKRLIQQVTQKVLGKNGDGRHDANVVVVVLLVLIACLILMGWGDGKQVHHHHWEYFNPPRDL